MYKESIIVRGARLDAGQACGSSFFYAAQRPTQRFCTGGQLVGRVSIRFI